MRELEARHIVLFGMILLVLIVTFIVLYDTP